eukprot:5270139-Lingulodinium_polyedra.AAC.1
MRHRPGRMGWSRAAPRLRHGHGVPALVAPSTVTRNREERRAWAPSSLVANSKGPQAQHVNVETRSMLKQVEVSPCDSMQSDRGARGRAP